MAKIEIHVGKKLVFQTEVQKGDWQDSFLAYYHPSETVTVRVREGFFRVVDVAEFRMIDLASLSGSTKMEHSYRFHSDAVFKGGRCHSRIRLEAKDITTHSGQEMISVHVGYVERYA